MSIPFLPQTPTQVGYHLGLIVANASLPASAFGLRWSARLVRAERGSHQSIRLPPGRSGSASQTIVTVAETTFTATGERCSVRIAAIQQNELVRGPRDFGTAPQLRRPQRSRVFRLHQTGIVNAPSPRLILGVCPYSGQACFYFLLQSDQHTTIRYLSNQTSSRRKLLMMLLTIIVQFFT